MMIASTSWLPLLLLLILSIVNAAATEGGRRNAVAAAVAAIIVVAPAAEKRIIICILFIKKAPFRLDFMFYISHPSFHIIHIKFFCSNRQLAGGKRATLPAQGRFLCFYFGDCDKK